MKKIELEELKREEETQTVEFKKSLSLRKEAMKALNSMVNSDVASGSVVFGVDPDGSVCGVERDGIDQSQLSLAQHIRDKFDPSLNVIIECVECESCTLIIVKASRPPSIPLHDYDGRAFIREGSSMRQLTVQDRNTLTRSRDRSCHHGPWKCDSCGMWIGVLSSVVVTDTGPKKLYDCSCGGEFWPTN